MVRPKLWRVRVARTWPLVVLAAALSWVTIATPYANWPPIRSDGAGYHAWTRALLNWDFSFCRWKEREAGIISLDDPVRGFCQNKYPPGLALLRLPVMYFALDRSMPPDTIEISAAEHRASLILGACFVWAQAALMVWMMALLRLNPLRSGLAVLLCVIGTGLFHYGTYDGSFTHAYSGFFCALLLAFAVRERVTRRPIPIPVLVISAFFLLAIRLTNVILLGLLVLGYLIDTRRAPFRTTFARKLLPVAAGAGLAVAIQLAYNYHARGVITGYSYGDEKFLWDRPMQLDVLFSYERGLFTYYPVYGLALILGFAVRGARGWATLLSALIIAYAGLYGFWYSWTLGGGMGHRGFVELASLGALTLSLAWNRPPTSHFAPLALLGVAAVLLTVQVMVGYWTVRFPFGGATVVDYRRQLRTLESFATGGTLCRVSRCDWWELQCYTYDEQQFAFCMADPLHPGNCVSDGRCAPIVAVRSLAAASQPYVSVTPPVRRRRPVIAQAEKVGTTEKFAWVDDPADASRVSLMSMASRSYVTAPQAGVLSQALTVGPNHAGISEVFTRVGSDRRFALRAWNLRYVSARARSHELIADTPRIGRGETFVLEYVRP